ncbi:MAG: hypothetical protein ACRDRW_05880 [Pseudonocardiaceae bacterium]
MIGIYVQAGSAVGLLPALIEGIGATAIFYGVVCKLQDDFANTLYLKKTQIEQQYTMDGPFTNGDWPSAVAKKMSDASVRDGGKSAWTSK